MKPAINPYDSRVDAVTLVDLDNQSKIISSHRTLADAQKAKAALTFDRSRRFGDPALRRFRIDSGPEALRSLAAVNNHDHWVQYSRAEYQDIVEAVRGAVAHYYNVIPDDDTIPYGPLDDEQPEDLPTRHLRDDDEPDDDIGDASVRTPYSTPHNTLVSNRSRSLPTDGELEQRESTWWPPPGRR
jgi:hypothetical protein